MTSGGTESITGFIHRKCNFKYKVIETEYDVSSDIHDLKILFSHESCNSVDYCCINHRNTSTFSLREKYLLNAKCLYSVSLQGTKHCLKQFSHHCCREVWTQNLIYCTHILHWENWFYKPKSRRKGRNFLQTKNADNGDGGEDLWGWAKICSSSFKS